MKVKMIAVLGGIFSLAGVGAASAADMAVKARPAPPPLPPPCVWCGFYIGLNAGGTWDRNDATYTQLPGGLVNPTASVRLDTSGFIGGGQVGYNWQWSNFVLGIEGD